jgi:hypothetical protein
MSLTLEVLEWIEETTEENESTVPDDIGLRLVDYLVGLRLI